MLDFAEVSRRIETDMSHTMIVAPVVAELLNPDHLNENGTVLHTSIECHKLAMTLQRQAQLLDEADKTADAQQAIFEAMRKRLLAYKAGLVVVLVWLSGVATSVIIARL